METNDEIQEEIDTALEFARAMRRKDKEETERLRRLVKFEAESLMLMKQKFGAEYVRSRGYNTEKADKKYGPGWLDREDAQP